MLMLQLEKYFYPNVSFKADPAYKWGGKKYAGRLEVKTKLNLVSKEERRWQVSLKIRSVQENLPRPYQFELEVVGNFKVSPDFPEEEMEEIVRTGGSSILYSASREFLLMVTSRGPFGVINLPTITFQKRTKRVKQDKGHPKPDKEGAQKSP